MGCRRCKESYYEAISKEQVALANKEDAQVFSTAQRIYSEESVAVQPIGNATGELNAALKGCFAYSDWSIAEAQAGDL
jgi:hypothetical protein